MGPVALLVAPLLLVDGAPPEPPAPPPPQKLAGEQTRVVLFSTAAQQPVVQSSFSVQTFSQTEPSTSTAPTHSEPEQQSTESHDEPCAVHSLEPGSTHSLSSQMRSPLQSSSFSQPSPLVASPHEISAANTPTAAHPRTKR